MSFEVNTGTAADPLDGTEKIPVSQDGLPRVVQTRRFPYYDGTFIRSEYDLRIDNGGVASSLFFGDLTGSFALATFLSGSDQLSIQTNNGKITNIDTGVDYISWNEGGVGVVINTVDSATFKNAGALRILDTNASHTLRIAVGSDLTANRTFTLTTGNANRTLDISAGSVTISAAGAALIDDANAAAQRTTLGLGTTDNVTFRDITADRGDGTGVVLLKGDGSRYLYYTGTVYYMASAPLEVPNGYIKFGSYTVGTVPSASTSGAGSMIYVSDESGGAVPAFSDGTNWRRVTDRAIIS